MRAVQGDQLEQGRRDEASVGQREERREAVGARQLLLVDTRGGHGWLWWGGAYPIHGKTPVQDQHYATRPRLVVSATAV